MQQVNVVPTYPRPYSVYSKGIFIEEAVAIREGRNIIPPHVGLEIVEATERVVRRQTACELKGSDGQYIERKQVEDTAKSHVLTYFPSHSISDLNRALISQEKGRIVDLTLVPARCLAKRVPVGYYAMVHAKPLLVPDVCTTALCLDSYLPPGHRLLRLREGIFFLVASLQLWGEFHPNGWTYFQNGWLARVYLPNGDVHLRRWSETGPLPADVDPMSIRIAAALI